MLYLQGLNCSAWAMQPNRILCFYSFSLFNYKLIPIWASGSNGSLLQHLQLLCHLGVHAHPSHLYSLLGLSSHPQIGLGLGRVHALLGHASPGHTPWTL